MTRRHTPATADRSKSTSRRGATRTDRMPTDGADHTAAMARAACPFVTDWRVARELTRRLPAGITTTARLLYVLLAGHLDVDGLAYPSIGTLEAEMGCHEDTVRRARAQLERAGLIVTTEGGGSRTNLYRLTDFRFAELSTPVAPARGLTPRADAGGEPATPRASAANPPRQRGKPPAPARDEEVEEVLKNAATNVCDDPSTFAAPYRRRWSDDATRRAWLRQYRDGDY